MPCRVRYLNSAGIHVREIPGISTLAQALPQEWLFYAALQCFPPRSHPIEIDALIVTDDRILVLELKDYNGTLAYNGDQWVLNGRPRGRSAVDMVSGKARKIRTLLSNSIPGISKYPVDSRVVLTGTATKAGLNAAEQPLVWDLSEARSIADRVARATLLGIGTLHRKKAYQFEQDFERVTRNARLWRPAEGAWDGYRVVEEDCVVHPRLIWREHRAERVRDPRFKALLRIWSFDQLPPGLNSAEHRRFIADRETRAIGLLSDLGSRLVTDGSILLPTGEDKQEILTQHFELRTLPRDWTTLDRFLERSRPDLTSEDRLLAASTLLNVVAELHSHGVAHRDLGPRSIWIGSSSKLALSGFMACQIPGDESLGDWYPTLRGYGVELPEDACGAEKGTAKQRDVFTLGRLICEILDGKVAAAAGCQDMVLPDLPPSLDDLGDCLQRAMADKPSARYDSAIAMSDEFALVLERAIDERVDQSILDRAETADIPYVRYPQHSPLKGGSRVNVYLHQVSDSERVVVKLWLGLRRGASVAADLALMKMVDGVGRLVVSPVDGLPHYINFGLSPIGPFVVYRYVDGVTLANAGPFNSITAVEIVGKLIHAVDALHAMDLFHGDVSRNNILIAADGSRLTLLDPFDLSEVGDSRIRTPNYCPEGWERLTEQQIDRYATLIESAAILSAVNDDRLTEALIVLGDELQRPIIETLEPAIIAIKSVEARLREPTPPRFTLQSPDRKAAPFRSDDGMYFVRAQKPSRDRLQYSIAGVDRKLTFELTEGSATRYWFSDVSYGSLMHASMYGTQVRCELDVAQGQEAGFDELLSFLESVVSPPVLEESATSEAEQAKPGTSIERLDVPRYWRSLIELEENFQPEVEILRDLGSRGALSAYAYERLGGDFDFDAESTVEVRLHGRKVGEVDLSQTDERTLVVRYSDRRLTTGDRVTLVDRRAKASLDRRRKAIERILSNEAALTGLIRYFSPNVDAEVVDYETEIEDTTLDAYGLNPGQKKAFRHIVRHGPVGLLQGPPGTGKTLFIAALAHWLITQAGARKILIASQSHEAVNNAIEKLIDLFKGLRRRPSLLRIGSKGITQKIRPYHTSSSRERYRVRFDNAFKHRVIALGAAVGLRRDFVDEAVNIERLLGQYVRRMHALASAAKNTDEMTGEDRRRYDYAMRATVNAFSVAGRKLLDRDVDAAKANEELEAAYNQLLDHHNGMSPGDVKKVRGLIALSLEWSAALASSHRNFEEFLAKTRTIIAATCVGAGQTRIRIDAKAFDWVIVDEAARCTPGELAVPVQVGRRVLLVGDHLQLRPMVEKQILLRLAEDMSEVSPAEFTRSDFERAYASSFGQTHGQILTEQYRMAPAICDLVSKVFYEPNDVRLTTSGDRASDPIFAGALPRLLARPITWIDTSAERNSQERKAEWNRHSFWNESEVVATMSLLERISKNAALVSALELADGETPVGIICMYSAQKVRMEQAFAQRPWDARFRRLVRIDTVDSYQGKENAIVIASLVRCNPRRESGHVGSPNRCNVALSRAKERLFIVGARHMWRDMPSSHPMRRVLEAVARDTSGAQVLRSGDI